MSRGRVVLSTTTTDCCCCCCCCYCCCCCRSSSYRRVRRVRSSRAPAKLAGRRRYSRRGRCERNSEQRRKAVCAWVGGCLPHSCTTGFLRARTVAIQLTAIVDSRLIVLSARFRLVRYTSIIAVRCIFPKYKKKKITRRPSVWSALLHSCDSDDDTVIEPAAERH